MALSMASSLSSTAGSAVPGGAPTRGEVVRAIPPAHPLNTRGDAVGDGRAAQRARPSDPRGRLDRGSQCDGVRASARMFPTLATSVFHGGVSTLDYLCTAPAAGTFAGPLTSGRLGRLAGVVPGVVRRTVRWRPATPPMGRVYSGLQSPLRHSGQIESDGAGPRTGSV